MIGPATLLIHAARVQGVSAATSVAVRGERIVAVGSRADVSGLGGPDTRVLSASTALVCPGFHDAHAHLVLTGLARRQIDLHGLDAEGVRDAVGAVASKTDPGAWIIATGLSPAIFPAAGPTPVSILDRWAAGQPVLLRAHDYHGAVLSQRGLALAGLAPETPVRFRELVERGPDGEPTGRIFESAAWFAEAAAVEVSAAERRSAATAAVTELHRAGIVALHEMSGSRDLDVLRELDGAGELGIDVLATISPEDVAERAATRRGRRLRIIGMKAFLDGALGSSTAALLDPYEDDPTHAGVTTLSREETNDAVRAAAAAGLASCLHAIGDAAVRTALDALEAAPLPHGPGPRHRVEHAQMIHDEDLARFARLAVVASIQPIHIAEDAPWVHRRWGSRSRTAFPVRRLLDSGAEVVFGSDAPIETLDVLAGIRCAVRRTGRDGTELHREEAVTVQEALEAYTGAAARAAGLGAELGSVTPGRLASLTLLDRDIVLAPEELDACRVAATIVRGHVVYEQGGER